MIVQFVYSRLFSTIYIELYETNFVATRLLHTGNDQKKQEFNLSQTEPDFSRTGRKKRRNRSNRLLNLLIGIVVVLIVIVSASIFFGMTTKSCRERHSR